MSGRLIRTILNVVMWLFIVSFIGGIVMFRFFL